MRTGPLSATVLWDQKSILFLASALGHPGWMAGTNSSKAQLSWPQFRHGPKGSQHELWGSLCDQADLILSFALQPGLIHQDSS